MKAQVQQPSNAELLKAAVRIVALFILATVPFMAGWIDNLLKFLK